MNVAALVLGVAAFLLTPWVSPQRVDNYIAHPSCLLIVAAVAVALLAGFFFRHGGYHRWALVASSALLLGAVACIGFSLYPNMLPSRPDPANSLTIHNSAATAYGLTVGLAWFSIGMSIAVLYQLYRLYVFSGVVRPGTDRY
jgi:cytochrome d ubiquinol oxidase subunit II